MIADKQGVEIDYCPQCRGIWFDRGELEKIIERSQSQTFGFGQSYHDGHHVSHHDHYKHDDHSYKHGYPHNRKKGFLSDLFDF